MKYFKIVTRFEFNESKSFLLVDSQKETKSVWIGAIFSVLEYLNDKTYNSYILEVFIKYVFYINVSFYFYAHVVNLDFLYIFGCY